MTGLFVIILELLLVFVYGSISLQRTQFFFSNVAYKMPKNIGRRPQRNNDQSRVVPHLYEGDSISVYICTAEWSTITLDNITLSNDGASDTIIVSFDGRKLNSIVTPFHSNWGAYWDMFIKFGPIGSTGLIPPGKHVLRFDVVHSGDCYGVEIGTLFLSSDVSIQVNRFWCDSGYSFAQQACLGDGRVNSIFSSGLPTTTPVSSTTKTAAATTTTKISTTTAVKTTTPFPDLVKVEQQSYRTECLDYQNVRVKFTRNDISGTRIIARADSTPHVFLEREATTGAKMCRSSVWQLGVIDNDNKEFKLLVPDSNVVFNITNAPHVMSEFPGKLLPFATSKVTIYFRLPDNIVIDKGSIFFAIGLVNLTKDTQIGLQYLYDETSALSAIQYLTFTSQWHVMGWNIPSLIKSKTRDNLFVLHFDHGTNVIMFDFLRLDFSTIDERKQNILLKSSDMFKFRGFRYQRSRGMTAYVDKLKPVVDLENVLVLYRSRESDTYHSILSVSKDGIINPHHKVRLGRSDNILFDMSGLMFHNGVGDPGVFKTPVQSLYITTGDTDVKVQLRYDNGSDLRLHVIPSETNMQILVNSFNLANDQTKKPTSQSITYVSAHVTDYLAAVNEVKIDDNVATPVMAKLDHFSGKHTYAFRKTSPINIYLASQVVALHFEDRV